MKWEIKIFNRGILILIFYIALVKKFDDTFAVQLLDYWQNFGII